MSAVNFEVEGSSAIVTIDRPGVRNAIDRPATEALAEAFHRFQREDTPSGETRAGAWRFADGEGGHGKF